MNLYLVLAIALGAITGVVEAPAARPVLLATRRDRRVERRAIRVGVRLRTAKASVLRSQPRTEERGPRMYAIAAPRAPAFS